MGLAIDLTKHLRANFAGALFEFPRQFLGNPVVVNSALHKPWFGMENIRHGCRGMIVKVAAEIIKLLLASGGRNDGSFRQHDPILSIDRDKPAIQPFVEDRARADIAGNGDDEDSNDGIEGSSVVRGNSRGRPRASVNSGAASHCDKMWLVRDKEAGTVLTGAPRPADAALPYDECP